MAVIVEKHPAVVTSVDDPEKRGRIKVTCAGFLGDEESDLPDWVNPTMDWGWFYVPDVGEQVEIEAAVSGDLDEVPGQTFLDAPDFRWRGKRFYSEEADAPVEARLVHADFKTNYGKRRGFATPFGHVMLFDDTEDKPLVSLTWVDKDANKCQLLFDTDGTVKLSVKDKHSIHLKENEIEMKLDAGAALKVTGKGGNAVAALGDGGVAATIADHLEQFYSSQLKVWLEAITVPTGMGISGTPVNAPAPSWNNSINSTKLKFPDG